MFWRLFVFCWFFNISIVDYILGKLEADLQAELNIANLRYIYIFSLRHEVYQVCKCRTDNGHHKLVMAPTDTNSKCIGQNMSKSRVISKQGRVINLLKV